MHVHSLGTDMIANHSMIAVACGSTTHGALLYYNVTWQLYKRESWHLRYFS